jgi:positive regulator of sigma E activity
MMATAIVPLVFMIVGALAYALSANVKIQEMGRLLFAAGAFALAFALATTKFSL